MVTQSCVMRKGITGRVYNFTGGNGGDRGIGTRSESSGGGWWEVCRWLYTWNGGGGGDL